jgi:Cysteine-rich CWC
MSDEQRDVNDKRSASVSICPGCGQRFVCGAVNGAARCWCMEQPLGLFEPVVGESCYCPECLQKRISERASQTA